jgi:16S rRNA (uracil1498-N3)-methyltransferase
VLDDDVTIDGAQGRHLARSLRLRSGEVVTAADGRGRWRQYTVASTEREHVVLHAAGAHVTEPELEPRLAVAFAITKAAKPDLVVQKLTELGVDRIVLLRAARSVRRWDADREVAAIDRLERIAFEAASQCRRSRLPSFTGFESPTDLASHRGLMVADPSGVRSHDFVPPDAEEWLLAVGPEGGFEPAELAALPGPRLALGPYVLRAETAAIAGVAVLTSRRSWRA